MKKNKKIMFAILVFSIISFSIPISSCASDNNAPIFYNLENVFNGSVIAEYGEKVEDDWGIRDNENIGGFKKSTVESWLKSKILYQNANDFNRFSQAYDSLPSYDTVALQKEEIPFRLGTNMTAAGKNAYIFDDAKGRRKLTLLGSGINSDYLCFAFAVNHSSVNVKIKVVFYDDSERIFDNIPLAWARDGDGWKYSCQRPELEVIDRISIDAENKDKNSIKIRGIAIPLEGRKVKNIEISGGYTDNSNTALLAITELPKEKTEDTDEKVLLKRIENFSVTDKSEITASNSKKVILACTSYIELIKRNYNFNGNAKNVDFYNDLLDRAKYVDAVASNKVDENNLSFYVDVFNDETGYKNAEITILNTNIKEKNCTFVFATYVDSMLTDINIRQITDIYSESIQTQILSLEKTKNTEYKIFVFENFENLKPLYTFFYEEM